MSEQEFENYLVLLNQLLKLDKQQQEAIAGELRDHMEERLADLLQSGTDRHKAVRIALEEFGDASELARDFSSVLQNRKRSLMMKVTAGTLALSIAGLAVVTAFWQDEGNPPQLLSKVQAEETLNDVSGTDLEDTSNALPFIETTKNQTINVRKTLETTVTFNCHDNSLRDFVLSMKALLNIPIEIDGQALDDLAIDVDAQISNFEINGISAKAAIEIVLDSEGLTWVAKNGYLWITSPEETDSEALTRIFPVWDLVQPPDQDVVGGPDNSDQGVDYDSLIELITAVIAPDSWEDVGGRGSIQGYRGLLVVNQTLLIHQEIEATLRDIRAACQEGPQSFGTPKKLSKSADRFKLALAQHVDWRFEDKPLKEVVQVFSQRLKLPVLFNYVALDDLGLSPDTPITSIIEGIQLGDAMKIVLDANGLVYSFQEEYLLITSPEEDEANISTHVYNVAQLVDPEEMMTETQIGVEIDSLFGLIESTIAHDSWENVGGEGSLQGLARHRVIVCANTKQIHQQVSDLLSALLVAAKTPNAAPADESTWQPQGLDLRYYDLTQNHGLNAEQLIKLISELIAPDSWGAQPHEPYIRAFSGRLIVRHDRATHQKITQMLKKLNLHVNQGQMQQVEGGMF